MTRWLINHARYGGPAPRLTGSVALDLHRMNRIIEVNEEFSYACVEPGVTFTDLYDYCKEHRLRVWPSVPSLGWGSVIGNVRSVLYHTCYIVLTEGRRSTAELAS